MFATLCELILLFRLDPNLSPSNVIDISRQASTESTADSGFQQNGAHANGSPVDEESLYVDAMHLKAVEDLVCTAMISPAALSLAFANPSGGSMNRRDRHGRAKDREVASPYVRMMRLLVRWEIRRFHSCVPLNFV